MTEFIELFSPGARHWREYRDAEKMLVVETKRAGDGPQPLDLDSGKVVLVVRDRSATADPAATGPMTLTDVGPDGGSEDNETIKRPENPTSDRVSTGTDADPASGV